MPYIPTDEEEIQAAAKEEAKNDLFEFLDQAEVDRSTLLELKQIILNFELAPDMYWDEEYECGCLKGTLYCLRTGEGPTITLKELKAEHGKTPDHLLTEGEAEPLEVLMQLTFNGARVDPRSPFESWLQDEYGQSLSEAKELAAWIDEYLEMMDQRREEEL